MIEKLDNTQSYTDDLKGGQLRDKINEIIEKLNALEEDHREWAHKHETYFEPSFNK
jgi:hypothetical protein